MPLQEPAGKMIPGLHFPNGPETLALEQGMWDLMVSTDIPGKVKEQGRQLESKSNSQTCQ